MSRVLLVVNSVVQVLTCVFVGYMAWGLFDYDFDGYLKQCTGVEIDIAGIPNGCESECMRGFSRAGCYSAAFLAIVETCAAGTTIAGSVRRKRAILKSAFMLSLLPLLSAVALVVLLPLMWISCKSGVPLTPSSILLSAEGRHLRGKFWRLFIMVMGGHVVGWFMSGVQLLTMALSWNQFPLELSEEEKQLRNEDGNDLGVQEMTSRDHNFNDSARFSADSGLGRIMSDGVFEVEMEPIETTCEVEFDALQRNDTDDPVELLAAHANRLAHRSHPTHP